MQRVIVTVKRRGEARVRDLEVPAGVEAGQLSRMIAQALRWDSDPAGQPIEYEIMAEPPGRILHPQESLAEAGAWDGAWLVFQPSGAALSFSTPPPLPPAPAPRPVGPPPSGGSPVAGWRPLGIDLPDEQESDESPSEKPSGFVWKQL